MTQKKRSAQQRRGPGPATPAAGAPETPPRPASPFGFNPDYTHVRRDLQRIAVLAVLLIGGMLAAWALMR